MGGGTGLGLAISKEIVKLMNGEIKATSIYGKGSIFSFTIQLDINQNTTEQHINTLNKGERILVVDDIETSREILNKILKSWDMDVVLSHSGKDAILKIENSIKTNKRFDFILLDWKMPELDGIQTAKKIKELNDKYSITTEPIVIMVTAYSKDDLLKEINKHNIQPEKILLKPITHSTLFDTMINNIPQDITNDITENIKYDVSVKPIFGSDILLVEDNEINQIVASQYLKNMDLNVTIANNGKEAVEIIKQKEFDIILMDLQMPIMDGIEATKEIKKLKDRNNIPIVAMTAAAMSKDKENSFEAGMVAHISKPIDIDILKSILLKYIQPNKPKRVFNNEQKEDVNILKEIDIFSKEIDGIDMQILKKKFNNDSKIVSILLSTFARKYKNIENDINEEECENDKFNRYIHSLKGESGNLSINNVYNIAKDINDSDDIKIKKELLKPLKENMNVAINSIEKVIPKSETSNHTLIIDQIEEKINTFIDQFDKELLVSLEYSDEIITTLKDILIDEEREKLQVSIDNLDYVKVKDILQTLKIRIEKDNTDETI